MHQEQTLSRDELKAISQEQVHQIVMQIQNLVLQIILLSFPLSRFVRQDIVQTMTA